MEVKISPEPEKPEDNFRAIISKDVRDYGNDPYFINKANKSKEFLDKHGFPKEIMDRRNNSKEDSSQ